MSIWHQKFGDCNTVQISNYLTHYSSHAGGSIEGQSSPYCFRGLYFPCFKFQGMTGAGGGDDELISNSSNLLIRPRCSSYSKF